MEKFTFFWHGPFSQWYPSDFVIDGVKYNCAEQYMMAEKARLFGDEKTERAIMGEVSPKIQKKLGRNVKDFDLYEWDKHAKDIVKKGNLAKFSQNEDLKKLLLETTGTTLVEASPFDRIWGIGLAADNPNASNRETWLGNNWLGEVLTEVRGIIENEK